MTQMNTDGVSRFNVPEICANLGYLRATPLNSMAVGQRPGSPMRKGAATCRAALRSEQRRWVGPDAPGHFYHGPTWVVPKALERRVNAALQAANHSACP